VRSYSRQDLQQVQFRSPDPYKAGKLIVYSAHTGCARPRCSNETIIFTVGAASVSIAALLQLWKRWKIMCRCPGGHLFRLPDITSWWVQQERTLP
jgi:hypothetical protein